MINYLVSFAFYMDSLGSAFCKLEHAFFSESVFPER